MIEKAKKEEDKELELKMNERVVRINKTHRKDAQRMIDLMGIPFYESPAEAEAQCTEFVKKGKAIGVASEGNFSMESMKVNYSFRP